MRKSKKLLALLTALSISASAFAGLATTAFAEGEYYTQNFESETAKGTDNNKTGDKQADDLTLQDSTRWHSFYGAGFMSIAKDSNPNINLHYQYAIGSTSGQRGAYYIPNDAVKTVDDNKRSVLEMDFSMSTGGDGSQLVLTNAMDLKGQGDVQTKDGGQGNADEGAIPTNSNYTKDYVIALYQAKDATISVATLDGNDAPATLTGYTAGAWAHLKAVMDFNEDTVVIEITSLDGQTTFLEETKVPMKGDNTAPGALVVSQPRNSSAKTGIDNIVFRPYADGDIKGTYYMATLEIDGKTISKTADKTTGLIDGVEDPTKTGYLFKGWAKDNDTENLMTTAEVLAAKLTADVTYTAVFEKDEDYIEPMTELSLVVPTGNMLQMSESADTYADNPIQVKIKGEIGGDLSANPDARVEDFDVKWEFKGFRHLVSKAQEGEDAATSDEADSDEYCDSYAKVIYDENDITKVNFQLKRETFNFYGEVVATVTYAGKTLTVSQPLAIVPTKTDTGNLLPKPGYVTNFDWYADEMAGYQATTSADNKAMVDVVTGGWAAAGGNSGRGLYLVKDEDTGKKYMKLKSTGTNSSSFAANKLDSAPTGQVVVEQDIKFYNANSSLLFKQDNPVTWSNNATAYSVNFTGTELNINNSKIANAQTGVWYKIVTSADVTSKLCYAKLYDMEGNLLGESDIVPFTNAGATAPTYLCYRTPDNANGELDFNNVRMYVPQIDGDLTTTISNDTLIIPSDIVLKDGINYDRENKKVIVKKDNIADDTEATLIAASYRRGVLTKVVPSPLKFKNGQATAENIEVSGETKFMVWDSLGGMKPVIGDTKTVDGENTVANTATLTVDAKSTEGYNITSNAEWEVVDAGTGEASELVKITPDASNSHNATLTVAKGAAAGTYNVTVSMGGKTKTIPVTVTGTQDSVKFTKSTSSIGIPLEDGVSQTYEYSAIVVDSENTDLKKPVTLAMYDKNNVNPLTNTDAISFNAETGILTVTSAAESTVVYIRATSTNSDNKPITRSLKVTIHGLAFDLGADAADGYTAVTPTTSYNEQSGYGISSGTTQVGGTSSLEDADSDYLEGAFTFQAKVEPKKVYAVTVKGASTNFTAEKVVAGLTGAASSGLSKKDNSDAYLIAVTDDILDLTFAAGSKVSSITIEKQPDKNPGSKPTIFTVGDSTLSNNGSWAYVISHESFPTLTDVAYFQCNGQGSQNLDTFYNGGQLMSRVLVNVAPGDYVTIGNMGTNGEGVNFEQAFNAYVDACEAMGAKVIINSYSPHGAVGGYADGYDDATNTFEGYRKDNYDNIVRKIYEERTTEGGEKYDPSVVGFMDIGKMADAAFNAFVADYAGTTMKFAVGEQGTKTAYADKNAAAQAIIACFGDHNHYGDSGKGFDRLASNLMVRGYEAVGECSGAKGIVNTLIEIVSADLAKTAE